jgi:hypothetical protein
MTSDTANVRIATYPLYTPEECSELLARMNDAKHLHTTINGLPAIGMSSAYSSADEYRAHVPHSNHEIATAFPLLFHEIAVVYRSLGHSPVYGAELALPLICLSKPIDTDLPRQFLDLATGDLKFAAPTGPCVQWHTNQTRDDLIFFS